MLNSFAPTSTSPPLPAETFGSRVMATPDVSITSILDAINAHSRWKLRFFDNLSGYGNNDLDYAIVARDDCCHLGRWILGIGAASFRSRPTFEHLRMAHTQFHLCAGEVLKLAQAGRMTEAEDLLSGEYARLSRTVVAALVRLSNDPLPD